MSYTKGAWNYAPGYSTIIVVNEYKLKMVADFGKCSLPETEDNARLMAASKEMLNALQLAEATIQRLDKHGSAVGTLQVIEAAIRKVEG